MKEYTFVSNNEMILTFHSSAQLGVFGWKLQPQKVVKIKIAIATPKSCQNQNSSGDPSKQHPNTTKKGWVFLFSKKHVLVGQSNVQVIFSIDIIL